MLVPAMKYVMLAALAACGTTDDRPQTLAYVTEAILAPNCASAECHSSLRAVGAPDIPLVFDTVAHAQKSLAVSIVDRPLLVPGSATTSYLITVISTADDFGNRMPLDHPLDNKDIFFIGSWIDSGAEGFTPPP